MLQTHRYSPVFLLLLSSYIRLDWRRVGWIRSPDAPEFSSICALWEHYASDYFCDDVKWNASHLLSTLDGYVVSNRVFSPRARLKEHFSKYPGLPTDSGLQNMSGVCSVLSSAVIKTNVTTLLGNLKQPNAFLCMTEAVGFSSKGSQWIELMHVIAAWMGTHLLSTSDGDAYAAMVPLFEHHVNLAAVIEAGAVVHGVVWSALALVNSSNTKNLWEFALYACRHIGSMNGCLHGVGHGFLQRKIQDITPQLGQCTPLRRHFFSIPMTILQQAENMCEAAPNLHFVRACLDGVYHHYFKYNRNNPRQPLFYPCTDARAPSHCLSRAFVTHVVFFRWIQKEFSHAFPYGISCNSLSVNLINHCIFSLSSYTFIGFENSLTGGTPCVANPTSLVSGEPVNCSACPTEGPFALNPVLRWCFQFVQHGFDVRRWLSCIRGVAEARKFMLDPLRTEPLRDHGMSLLHNFCHSLSIPSHLALRNASLQKWTVLACMSQIRKVSGIAPVLEEHDLDQ